MSRRKEFYEIEDFSSGSGFLICENCGQSMEGGEYTMPWEDGDNEYGYTTCPHCGHENIDYSQD